MSRYWSAASGKVPLDPTIGQFCDEGQNLYDEKEDSVIVKEYKSIVKKIFSQLSV